MHALWSLPTHAQEATVWFASPLLALQIEKFLTKEVSVMQWVALAAFIIQILSVLLACWLTSVQKAELEAAER